jgi:hypothetical protein
MAFKVKAVPIEASNTTIFQMAAGSEGAIHGLVFCNNSAGPRTLTVKLLDASEGTTTTVFVTTIDVNAQYTWPKPINMESGDALIATGTGLIALHSTYVGTATPATQGFVGRGAWTSIASYNANDVVSYNNNSYLANAANTNSTPPSANWTLLAAQGTAGTITNNVRTPTAVYPLTGGLAVNPVGPLEASPYAPLYSVNERLYRTFQVAISTDTAFSSPVFSLDVNADSTAVSPALIESANYIWRCRDVSEEGVISDWMTTQSFLTKDYSVNTPTVTVEGAPSSVNQSPLITLSAYTTSPDQTATYLSTDWEVRRVSDNVLVYSSYNDTLNVSSITIPPGILVNSTAYAFRARYNSTIYGSSAYGSTSATTLATYVQQLFPALPFVSNAVVTAPSGYPLKKAFAVDATRSIHIYQRFNTNTTLGTAGQRWYMAVVTNTVNGPVTDTTKHLILPATVQTNATPQIVMRTTTAGYIVWGNSATNTICIFADFSISGDTITLGTQTSLTLSSSAQSTLAPTITKIRDDWYMVVNNNFDGSTITSRVNAVEIVGGLPVVGTATFITQVAQNDIVSIGGDRAAIFSSAFNQPQIYTFSKIGANPLTYTSTGGTAYPASVTSFANISATALSANTAMIIGYASAGTARTTAIVVSGLNNATQTYSSPYGFNTVLPSVVGDITALNSSTVLYTRSDSVSTLTYDAVTGLINETGRTVPTAAGEVVSITALQTPNIATPNATAAHLYAGWASATDAYTATSVTVSGGAPVLSPVAYLLGFATNPTYQGSKTHAALSSSRAIAVTREFDETSTAYTSTILTLFDTANQTPTVLSRLNISGGLAITGNNSYLVALSPTKILVMSSGTTSGSAFLSLVTVSGNTMTLNQSVAYPTLSNQSSDISRLSDTSAVLTYTNTANSLPRVGKITLDGAGTSMILGAEIVLSASTASYCRASAFSATRAVVWYAARLALLDVSGSTPVVLQDISAYLQGLDGPAMVSVSATSALYFTGSSGAGNVALVVMSGDTITAPVGSSCVISNFSTISIAPTTSTTGLIFGSQTSNLTIYPYTISGTTVTISAAVNSTIGTSGSSSSSIISGAVIAPSVQPYTGVPPTSGISLLVYRDNLSAAGSTNSYKIQKYQRA